LFNQVWENQSVSEQVLFQGIKELRETFGSTAKTPKYIFTYPKQGYMWDVKETILCEDSMDEPPSQKKVLSKRTLVISAIAIISAAIFIIVTSLWHRKPVVPFKPNPKRVAILPLFTMNNQDDTLWAKTGIEELLFYAFERNPNISTIPRQTIVNASVSWFPSYSLSKEKAENNQDIQSIREKLGVDFIVCGRIGHHEEETNLFIQLYDESGLVYWDYYSEEDISLLIRKVYSELSLYVGSQRQFFTEKEWEFSGYLAETYARGIVALNKNDNAQARKFFKFCLDLQPDFDLAKLLLAKSYSADNEYSRALSIMLELSSHADDTDPEFRSEIYYLTASSYGALGKMEKGLEVLEQGISFARQYKNPYILANFLNLKGRWYSDEKGTSPDELYGEALHLFKEIGDIHGQSMVISSMAKWYSDRGFFKKAIPLFKQLKHTSEQLGNYALSARSSFNLCDIAMHTHRLESAWEHITRAKDLFETNGRPLDVTACYMMMGEIDLTRGNWEEARKNLLYAHSQLEEQRTNASEYRREELYIWICLGLGNYRFGKKEQGEFFLQKAENRAHELRYAFMEALILLWKGDLQAEEQRFDQARDLYESAKKTYSELNHKMGTRDALLSLAYLDLQENKELPFQSTMKQIRQVKPAHPFTQILEIEYALRHDHGEQVNVKVEHLLSQFPFQKNLLGTKILENYELKRPANSSSLYPLMLTLP
jgi:tetratricopeptide (TPR) repeat protein